MSTLNISLPESMKTCIDQRVTQESDVPELLGLSERVAI